MAVSCGCLLDKVRQTAWSADDEDWTVGLADQLLADGAEQQPLQTVVAASADHYGSGVQ
jgi:hypothetical protein